MGIFFFSLPSHPFGTAVIRYAAWGTRLRGLIIMSLDAVYENAPYHDVCAIASAQSTRTHSYGTSN